MKKWLTVFLVAALLIIAGCAQGNETEGNNAGNGGNSSQNESQNENTPDNEPNEQVEEVTITVGASEVPHSEILNFVAPALQEQGVNLEVVVFNDYVQPNVQLFEGGLDANFFQHKPYLDDFNAERGYDLVSVAGIHIEPFGVYSNTIESLEELQDGANVAIPNDPSNRGRAILLLAQNGLITLDEEAGLDVTPSDIVDNPRNLQFVELEAAMLPRVLDEFDIATINTNYALQADLNPVEDAIAIEGADSPYINILAARPDNQDSDAIQKLIAALQSPEVEQFINETYDGAVVPTFQ